MPAWLSPRWFSLPAAAAVIRSVRHHPPRHRGRVPARPARPIVVGSANFTESSVIAEIYSQALKAKGIESSTKLGIGSREVYIQALQDDKKSISVVPEYTGNLLLNFDKNATAKTAEEVEAALPAALPADLKVLKASPASDQDVYVVTKEFSEQKGVTSLADLSRSPKAWRSAASVSWRSGHTVRTGSRRSTT